MGRQFGTECVLTRVSRRERKEYFIMFFIKTEWDERNELLHNYFLLYFLKFTIDYHPCVKCCDQQAPANNYNGLSIKGKCETITMLNSVRQHNCFITQSNYIGYMFRLLISHLQAYFNRLVTRCYAHIVCRASCE